MLNQMLLKAQKYFKRSSLKNSNVLTHLKDRQFGSDFRHGLVDLGGWYGGLAVLAGPGAGRLQRLLLGQVHAVPLDGREVGGELGWVRTSANHHMKLGQVSD